MSQQFPPRNAHTIHFVNRIDINQPFERFSLSMVVALYFLRLGVLVQKVAMHMYRLYRFPGSLRVKWKSGFSARGEILV